MKTIVAPLSLALLAGCASMSAGQKQTAAIIGGIVGAAVVFSAAQDDDDDGESRRDCIDGIAHTYCP